MTTNQATPPTQDPVRTSIFLPREARRKLRIIAAQSDRTVSEEIRFLVERHVSENEEAVAA